MTMNEKKYKRLEYLRHNIDYLTIRERQEYYELLNELKKEGNYSESEEFEEYTEPEYSDYESENFQQRDLESLSNNYNTNTRNTRESSPSPEKNRNKISTGNKGSKKAKSGKKKKRHWLRTIFGIIILIIVLMVGFFVYGYQRGVKHEGSPAKQEKFTSLKNSDGSVNILLLGADQRPWQSSGVAHTDSIMVLHVNGKDHKIQIVSFMRDTLVNIPDVGSSDSPDSKINSAFTIGEQYNKQGVNLMSETLKKNFGINCQYYAVVDFSSFATIIDSLFPTGLKIDAKFSTVNGETLSAVPVPDDLAATEGKTSSDKDLTAEEAAELGYPDGGGTFMMIKPGTQKMDGRMLLNYARFRHDDEGDYGRVKRQQQVLETVMSKMKNPLALFTASSALGTTRAVTMT
ncbi:MAG: LCP family protein, partial [Lactococcus cremoris]